ncbi:MAG TPA: hypothetical protein VLG14_15210 [Sphingomonas sp.]|nr:hypothetical protein [Sphingomonas sp.]
MESDKLNALGPLMNEIGQELADAVGGGPNGVFFYVEAGEGWHRPSIFKDEGAVVRYYDPASNDLGDLIFDLWYFESDETKRWSVMEYAVTDGKFEVTFKYPEEIDVTKPDRERRRAAVRARFGDKQVVYPPTQEGALEYKPDAP